MARRPRLSIEEFERLVVEAMDGLPDPFRTLIENVVVAVEEEPTDEDFDETDTPDEEELLGIFRGRMRTQASFDDLPSMPPEVVVFRGPILRSSSSRREAIREIRETVIHELGHYFGLEDAEMPY